MFPFPASNEILPIERIDRITDPDLYLDALEQRIQQSDRYLKMNGFEIVSQNGQRISTNLRLDPQQMETLEGNELFIGHLPRHVFEDQLLPHLSMPGRVYKVRLMMDFSKTNRGFGFVKYASVDETVAAKNYLDGLTIIPNTAPIGAKPSFDNKRLFFSELPEWCTEEQLASALKQADINGIANIEMSRPIASSRRRTRSRKPSRYSGPNTYNLVGPGNQDHHHPFCSTRTANVDFTTHSAALLARRILMPGDVRLFGRHIKLDWGRSDVPEVLAKKLNEQQTLRINSTTTMAIDQYNRQHRERTQSAASSMLSSATTCDMNNNNYSGDCQNFNQINNLDINGNHDLLKINKNPFLDPFLPDNNSNNINNNNKNPFLSDDLLYQSVFNQHRQLMTESFFNYPIDENSTAFKFFNGTD